LEIICPKLRALSGTDEVMRMIDKMVENLEEEKTSEVGKSGKL
jgi:hypothetical protein